MERISCHEAHTEAVTVGYPKTHKVWTNRMRRRRQLRIGHDFSGHSPEGEEFACSILRLKFAHYWTTGYIAVRVMQP